jgi:hypothetical protein
VIDEGAELGHPNKGFFVIHAYHYAMRMRMTDDRPVEEN